ncbi:MAG TPA: S41 family peptidase, partial [Opitutaceae bacterium]|nr:S41 family peptidase [Opitutaceae bacterium]
MSLVPPRWFLALVVLAALLGGCATVPPPSALLNYAGGTRAVAPEERTAFNARVFDQAADWVARRYYDPALNGADWSAARARHRPAALAATTDAELYVALNALLDELRDEHTCALSPTEVDQYRNRRSALLGFRTGPLPEPQHARRILAVFPGSAADRAGVRPGWILLAADDRPPGEVLGVGKLSAGQLVRCDFLDTAGQPRRLELRASTIEYPPVRDARRLGDGVLVLAFDSFDLSAARWVRAELKREQPAGLVLDLRDNVGGEARALAAILAEIFPGRAPIGGIRGRTSAGSSARRSPRHFLAAHYSGPLAVLVSERSASAAEILAAIVQHEKRGVVVGTATPGNVLVCVRWPLPGGGELQLSVYDYVGPDGRRLEGRGVTPDVPIAAAPGAEPDPQLEAARAVLRDVAADR